MVSPPKGVTRCGPHQPNPLATPLTMSTDYYVNHSAYLQEMDKIAENESVEWRQVTHKCHAGADIVAVSYSSQVHVRRDQRLSKLTEPELE